MGSGTAKVYGFGLVGETHEREVGLLIAMFIPDEDPAASCWPSADILHRLSGRNERTVRRYIETLEALGDIEVEPQGRNHIAVPDQLAQPHLELREG